MRMRNEPKQERSREKLQRVLEAADREFGEHGFHRTKMTSIAKRAEISAGALYRLFADKESIAEGLASRFLEDTSAAFAPLVEMIHPDAATAEIASLFVRASAELHLRHPGYYALAVETAAAPDGAAKEVRAALLDALEAQLDDAGLLVGDPVRRRSIGMVFEIIRHFLFIGPQGDTTREEHVVEIEKITTAYLTAIFGE